MLLIFFMFIWLKKNPSEFLLTRGSQAQRIILDYKNTFYKDNLSFSDFKKVKQVWSLT
jgi:hypothetical protein